jgi:cobaltochelatase CobN
MAGFLARGSVRLAAFPSRQWDETQWHWAGARRLQLRGQPWFGSGESRDPRFLPHSLITLSQETINQTWQYTVATLACQWSCQGAQASMGNDQGLSVSAAFTRLRLLLAAATAEDSSWAAWLAARDKSANAARIVLQRVSRRDNPESQPAVGLGYGETLRWFGPVADAATRELIIGYAEQVLAAGAFVAPGAELGALSLSLGGVGPVAASGQPSRMGGAPVTSGALVAAGASGELGMRRARVGSISADGLCGASGAGAGGAVDVGRAANAGGVAGMGRAADAGGAGGPASEDGSGGADGALCAEGPGSDNGAAATAVGRRGIILLSHAETDLLALNRAVDDLPAGFPTVVGHSLNGVTSADALSALVGAARGSMLVVIVRVHGTAASVIGLVELVAEAQKEGWSIVVISGIGADAGPLPRTSNISADLAAGLTAYFMAGGVGNVVQGIRRVAQELLGVTSHFAPPAEMPAHGLYHPDLLVTSVAEWQSHRAPNKPVALVLFYRAHVLSGNLQFVDHLVRALEFRGFSSVGVFTSSLRDRDESGTPAALRLVAPPAVIVNTVSFPMLTLTSLEPPPSEAYHTSFEAMGVPIMQAICSGSTRSAWVESGRGLGPAETAMNIALPECDGRVITVPISFKENHRYVPDDERIGRVADIARRLASLRVTPNRDKRVAVVLSNSGGKAQKVGGAVGLDTPASVLRWLSDMRDRGYDVGALPASPDELMSMLLAQGCYDERCPLEVARAWRMPRVSYTHWFRAQSTGFKKAVREAWGEPTLSGATLAPPFWRAGKKSDRAPLLALYEPHSDDSDYMFSGVAFGNVLVAIQPPRGFGFDQETMYHSPDLPPCHHYAAFYRWLDQGWCADAVIHFGTHGTLEWLPGKSLATSAECAPDVLLGDLPLFYPFVVNNPGEGAQAKRRSHAVIIDHLVPPLTQAETYGPLASLARLVEEYYRAESMDPSKLIVLRGQIWDLVQTERLDEDLKQIRRERHADHVHSWDDRITEQGVPRGLESLSGRGFAHLLEDLDAYLCDLGRAQIRGGLHVFGVAPVGDALVDLMFAVLYSPNGSVPSLVEAVTRAFRISPAALRERQGVWPEGLVPALAEAISAVDRGVAGSAGGSSGARSDRVLVVTVGQVRTAVDRVARELLVALAERDFASEAVNEAVASRFATVLQGTPADAAGESCSSAAPLATSAHSATASAAPPATSADDATALVAPLATSTDDATALTAPLATSTDALDAVRATLQFACEVLAPNLARTTDETRNLLAALDGRYVPAGPSGAPSRGMAHVLPTGRNFYTVDPRGLPTPAAWTTGLALADASLRRFHDDEGRWPESVALSVWGTPTMRTGGDELAQALALLGVRPIWEPVTRRTCGMEVIPLSELSRPRIDITLRVSGFFRDAFPALIQLFDDAVQRVVMLDEPIEQNFPRKHWLAETAALVAEGLDAAVAARRASYRVFSSKAGAYGTGVMDLIENRSWRDARDIAEVVLAWGAWAYGSSAAKGSAPADGNGVEAADAFRRRVTTVELALHNRDNREQDLFDSSDHFEYHGGLVAAVSSLSGTQPHAYVGDSSDPSRPDVRTLRGEALRVFRSRVVNPKWLAGIQRHGYRGGVEMATTIDSLFGFAATADIITDWMFEAAAEKFAMGDGREFLERTNPWALNAIAERLLEAEQRQLWSAKSETLESLRSVLIASEAAIEGRAEELQTTEG